MSPYPDRYYIDKVLQGEANAFSPLVDRYKHMVFTLAVRIVKNTEEAEEVAQDAFVKAYKALPKFKGDAKFSTWMYKIAYYGALDHLKKMRRYPKTEWIEGYIPHSPDVLQNTFEEESGNMQSAMIKRAMQKLPPDHATILTLHYFEELSLKEISKIMGASAD
ncbi:MAG: sigma-70 family RNA polymerase sigma factor, partial [Bacteroidota bacterium]